MKENPFQYGKPVRNSKNFFGREEEIRGIYNQILALNSISLIGERKIGKTSLFLHLVHPRTLANYGIPAEDILMLYVDIPSCSFSESSDVFRRFLEFISEKASGNIKDEINILLQEEYIHFRNFEDIIKKINNNGQKIVFFLDEFESISMVRQGDIFSRLRYLAQMYDVVFVISTIRDLVSLFQEKRIWSSPFFNIFTKYQICGLDEKACHELITASFEGEGIKVDPSIVDSIIDFSGTNPFFLKVTCFFYFEMVMKGQVTFDNNLKAKVQQELEPHHRYNWEHLPRDEKAALLDIVMRGNTSDIFAERSLEGKGHVVKEKEGIYVISESFHNYLKDILRSHPSSLDNLDTQIAEIDIHYNLTENDRNALKDAASRFEEHKSHPRELISSLFDLIGYFELETRNYIGNTLETALGKAWFDSALDDTSRKEIDERIFEGKKRRMSYPYPENPLNYTILEDLKDIVLRRENWNLCFSQYFEDKITFESKMQEIIDAKNWIAHFHPIHSSEAVIVIQNILWMLACIRKKF